MRKAWFCKVVFAPRVSEHVFRFVSSSARGVQTVFDTRGQDWELVG